MTCRRVDRVGNVKKEAVDSKVDSSNSIEEYISGFPAEVQEILRTLREVIRKAAPGAEEKMSYRMPTFVLHGNLVHFAAFKSHIGLYPAPSGVEAFLPELSAHRSGKGSIQFPIDKPLPYDLVSKIVQFRVAENTRRAEDNLKMKKRK
jgi:uncharacterized protein YdhG (YjbR/CyaY superfamily)